MGGAVARQLSHAVAGRLAAAVAGVVAKVRSIHARRGTNLSDISKEAKRKM